MFELFLYLYIVKAKELIYNIKTILLEANSPSGSFTDQHLMYMLDEGRATLAKRRMSIGEDVEQMTQIIDVVPSIVSPTTANEIGTIGNTRVLSLTIPQPVRYKHGEAVFNLGPTDGQSSYTQISYSQLRTALYRKYTANSAKWFWYENKIYIINSDIDSRSLVRVRGVFSEPHKVIYANKKFNFLDPFDFEYPLSLNDADAVYKLAFGSDLGWVDIATGAVSKAISDRAEAERRRKTEETQNRKNAKT